MCMDNGRRKRVPPEGTAAFCAYSSDLKTSKCGSTCVHVCACLSLPQEFWRNIGVESRLEQKLRFWCWCCSARLRRHCGTCAGVDQGSSPILPVWQDFSRMNTEENSLHRSPASRSSSAWWGNSTHVPTHIHHSLFLVSN